MPPDQHDHRAGEPSPSAAAGSAAFVPGVIRAAGPKYRIQPEAVMRIGRRPDNDIVVNDLGVSKQHAELRRSAAGRYHIRDLGSHRGTFVNGTRVDEAELNENDIVGIGHATLRLAGDDLVLIAEAGQPPAPSSAPTPAALARIVLHWTDGTTSTVYPPGSAPDGRAGG